MSDHPTVSECVVALLARDDSELPLDEIAGIRQSLLERPVKVITVLHHLATYIRILGEEVGVDVMELAAMLVVEEQEQAGDDLD